jgi:hypothetical protein
MAHNNSRFATAYVFLVIFPLLGLVGVLKRGHDLAAPVSVEGLWKLQIPAHRLTAPPLMPNLFTLVLLCYKLDTCY